MQFTLISSTVELVLILLIQIQQSQTNHICPTLNEIDEKCAAKFLYFGHREAILVIDEESYRKNCNLYEEGMECLGDFIDSCMTGLPRIVAESIYKTVRQQFQTRCKDPEIHDKFIKHSRCLINETIREQFHQCGDRYFAMAERIKFIPDQDEFAPAACCLMVDFQKCIEIKNRDLCNDHEDNGLFWTKTFDEISGDTQTFCYGYDTHDNCLENFPQNIWQKILLEPINRQSVEMLRKQKVKYHSLFFTNVDLANKLQL